jgi:hypothetical protein
MLSSARRNHSPEKNRSGLGLDRIMSCSQVQVMMHVVFRPILLSFQNAMATACEILRIIRPSILDA